MNRVQPGARALVEALCAEAVDVVFGIPGGAVLPLYDALHDAPIRHVLVRHEQAAARVPPTWSPAWPTH